MKWNRLIVNTSNWIVDLLVGFYAIGFFVLLFVFVNDVGMLEDINIVLNDDYKYGMEAPIVKAGPGMESDFEVSEVKPIAHEVTIKLKNKSWFLAYLPLLLYAIIYFYVLILLSRLVRSAKKNDLFSTKNVVRLRIIGLLVIANQLVSWLGDQLVKWFYKNYLVSTDLTYVKSFWFGLPDVLSSSLFLGLLVIIIAEAFAYGLKLKQENELTI